MGGQSKFIMLLAPPFPSLLHRPFSLVFLRPFTRRLSTTIISTSPRRFTLSFPRTIRSFHQQLHSQSLSSIGEPTTNSPYKVSHPWPEWSHLINMLLSQEHQSPITQDRGLLPEDAFVVYEEKELSDEFSRCATACLAYARARPDLLGLLSRRDIEVIVSNGTPFLFKTALNTARRMRAHLGLDGSNVLESDHANTVDIMKYIISYASNPSVPMARNNLYSRELLESSVRNLLCQMTGVSLVNPALDQPASEQYQFLDEYDQTSRPLRQNVQMKRGDWICPKCSFMNFARNVKCLECEEPRPKRQLTGGEWECPECNFFNYGKNLACLRCDCKRPEEVVDNCENSMSKWGFSENGDYRSNMNSRLVENEEKAQRWFNKASQLNNSSDLSSLAADEDFPEIMPLRKGENRFVVSTRTTPLERRMANSQTWERSGNYGTPVGDTSRSLAGSKTLDSSIRQSLDQVLGCSSPASGTDVQGIISKKSTDMVSSGSLSRPTPSEYGRPQESDSSPVPIAPLPADMFSRPDQNFKTEVQKDESCDFVSSASSPQSASVTINSDFENPKHSVDFSKKPGSQTDNEKEDEKHAEKSQRWFQRVAELHNVKDLPGAILDEEFPEIMPMRRGENRFVVSKKKDRSLTSPAYKRQVALEQDRNSKFVPFVPFPPGYFARKDTQVPDQIDSSIKPLGKNSSSSKVIENQTENQVNGGSRVPQSNAIEETGNQVRSSGDQRGNNRALIFDNSNQSSFTTRSLRSEIKSSGSLREQNTSKSTISAGGSWQVPENQNLRSGRTGKSLEGSAVKEPDPLDMSEEAKAERWFRRVAQIKDISELSQIPDEDFPSIMPMRKGVNRFVVSKRKTPLERRLTSQHRRNLPTVSSDLTKKEDNND